MNHQITDHEIIQAREALAAAVMAIPDGGEDAERHVMTLHQAGIITGSIAELLTFHLHTYREWMRGNAEAAPDPIWADAVRGIILGSAELNFALEVAGVEGVPSLAARIMNGPLAGMEMPAGLTGTYSDVCMGYDADEPPTVNGELVDPAAGETRRLPIGVIVTHAAPGSRVEHQYTTRFLANSDEPISLSHDGRDYLSVGGGGGVIIG